VTCKDTRSGDGFGGGYLTIGPLKICEKYDFEKGAWSRAKLEIGKHYPVLRPQYDYPWLMRLRLQYGERKYKKQEKAKVKAMMVQGAANVMQVLAQAVAQVANGSAADPLGAKSLLVQAEALAEAESKAQHEARVSVQNTTEAKVATNDRDRAAAQVPRSLEQAAAEMARVIRSLEQAATEKARVKANTTGVANASLTDVTSLVNATVQQARVKSNMTSAANASLTDVKSLVNATVQQARVKANVASVANARLTGAKNLVNATVQHKDTILELAIADMTNAIANHSQSHNGRCPSQLSLLGANAEISEGIGCRLEEKGRPLCMCPSWPFKVCSGQMGSKSARSTDEIIQVVGQCRPAMWPLILLLFILLLPSAAWLVWVKQ